MGGLLAKLNALTIAISQRVKAEPTYGLETLLETPLIPCNAMATSSCWCLGLSIKEKNTIRSGLASAGKICKKAIDVLEATDREEWFTQVLWFYLGEGWEDRLDAVTENLSRCYGWLQATTASNIFVIFSKIVDSPSTRAAKGNEFDVHLGDNKIEVYPMFVTTHFFDNPGGDPFSDGQEFTGVTILHEVSHFACGTDDLEVFGEKMYDREKCGKGANDGKVNPVNNADTLALLARDLYFCSMGGDKSEFIVKKLMEFFAKF